MVCKTGYIVTSIASILSIFACSFINYLILGKKELRSNKENKQLVILLTIYTLLCLSSLIPYFEDSKGICDAQGFLIQVFSLSGVLWTGYIALYRFLQFKEYRDPCYYKLVLIIIFLFAIFTAAIPFASGDEYKRGLSWCWYGKEDIKCPKDDGKKDSDKEESESDEIITTRNSIYTFLFFYAICWTVIIWIIFVFSYMHFKSRSMGAEPKRIEWFKYFPLILVFCFIPLTICRIIQSAIPNLLIDNKDFQGYFIFSATLMRLLGFFNAFVYGFNNDIRNMINLYWGRNSETENRKSSNTIEIIDQKN